MSFAEILSSWEKRAAKRRAAMEELLEKYPPNGEALACEREGSGAAHAGERRRKLLALPPQDTLDLHGMGLCQALEATERFISACRARGLKKVLVIHGKGKHSRTGPVLAQGVRTLLEKSPQAGEFGMASPQEGGRGALWVLLR